jgi:hypothetical protein
MNHNMGLNLEQVLTLDRRNLPVLRWLTLSQVQFADRKSKGLTNSVIYERYRSLIMPPMPDLFPFLLSSVLVGRSQACNNMFWSKSVDA